MKRSCKLPKGFKDVTKYARVFASDYQEKDTNFMNIPFECLVEPTKKIIGTLSYIINQFDSFDLKLERIYYLLNIMNLDTFSESCEDLLFTIKLVLSKDEEAIQIYCSETVPDIFSLPEAIKALYLDFIYQMTLEMIGLLCSVSLKSFEASVIQSFEERHNVHFNSSFVSEGLSGFNQTPADPIVTCAM